MTTKKPCLYLQVEDNYGTKIVRAHVGKLDPSDGNMLNVSWRDRFGNDRLAPELDGFTIRAYVGSAAGLTPLEGERGVWGYGVEYDLYRIDDPKQAQAIARVLTKVETGMQKLNSELGYLAAADFAGYVLRVARILGIRDVYIRSVQDRVWKTSGEVFRKVDGSGLQYWVTDINERARDGKPLIHTR